VVIGVEFPNPVDWAIDKVTGFVTGAATAGFELVIGGLVAWVVDAVVWVVGGVFNFFLDATDPNVQADWFVTGDGPYATTATIGATLLVLFALVGIVQGTLRGDPAGMLRSIALDLPVSVLGMVGLVTVTQALIRLTDVLSMHITGSFQDDIRAFGTVVASLQTLSGGTSTAFVVFLLGLVTVVAGLVLVAELVIRAALIYVVVALAPIVFATRLWPATRDAARKLLELLCALILSKLVIAVALSVAAAAAVGAGSGGEVTALPEPEVFAEDPGGSVTQAVGILLTAAAAFGVAAFSPLLIARLLPLTEAAVVAQGLRSGPTRTGQQALMATNSIQLATGHRLQQLAAGRAAPVAAAIGPAAPLAVAGGAAGSQVSRHAQRTATAPTSPPVGASGQQPARGAAALPSRPTPSATAGGPSTSSPSRPTPPAATPRTGTDDPDEH